LAGIQADSCRDSKLRCIFIGVCAMTNGVLIQITRLNDVDPHALASALTRINDYTIHRLPNSRRELWAAAMERRKVAA
jgi:hypothetical protein